MIGSEDDGGCFYIAPTPTWRRVVRWLNPFYVYRRIVGWWRWRKFVRGGGFQKMSFPLIRRVWPNLIANEIVKVQPMSLPTENIFAVDFKFGCLDGIKGSGSLD